jgi:class 3 adenylate cyclase
VENNILALLENHVQKVDSNFLFIKYYSHISLSDSHIQNFFPEYKDAEFLQHTFYATKFQEAYEPFAQNMRLLYEKFYAHKYSPSQFIDKCKIYSLHKDLFTSFLETGKFYRKEDMLLPEKDYEEQRFIEDIIKIFSFISQKYSLFLVFYQMQFSSSSFLKTLNALIRDSKLKNIVVVGTFDDTQIQHEYLQFYWQQLQQTLEEKEIIFNAESPTSSNEQSEIKTLELEPAKIPYYTLLINNMFISAAFKQAIFYSSMLQDWITFNEIKVERKDLLRFYIACAYVFFYSENLEKAMFYTAEIANNLVCEAEDDIFRYEYHYLSALICIYWDEKISEIHRHISKCIELARKLNDKQKIIKAKLLEYMYACHGWRVNKIYTNKPIKLDLEFIKELEKEKYLNNLSYIYTQNIENEVAFLQKVESGKSRFNYFYKGLSLGVKTDNRAFLQNAFFYKDFIVDYYYLRKVKILINKCRDSFSLSNEWTKLVNAGCSLMGHEKVLQAHEVFCQALSLCYNRQLQARYRKSNLKHYFLSSSKQIEHIGETLYNMAINAILVRDYQNALNFLNPVLKILENSNKLGLSICNIAKLYGMTALCYIHINPLDAHTYIAKSQLILAHLPEIEKRVDFNMWDDSLFFYFFVKGLLAEKDAEEAIENLHIAKKYLDFIKGQHFVLLPLFTEKVVPLLRKFSLHGEADELLTECIDFCKKENLRKTLLVMYALKKNETFERKNIELALDNESFSLNDILNMFYSENIEILLQEKIQDNYFLSSWQNAMKKKYHRLDEFYCKMLDKIRNFFNFDCNIYIKVEDDKPVIKYVRSTESSVLHQCDACREMTDKYTKNGENTSFEITESNLTVIKNFFEENRLPFICHRTNPLFKNFASFLPLWKGKNIVTLVGNPVFRNEKLDSIFIGTIEMKNDFMSNSPLLNPDRLSTLTFAYNWLVDAIEDLKITEQLEKEKKNTETLLLNILPNPIVKRMQKNNGIIADYFEEVSVMFADIIGFTEITSKYPADKIVRALNDLFSRFDNRAICFGVEKIKTIGDAYMAVCGLSEKDENHALKLMEFARGIFEDINEFNKTSDIQLKMRVGINSGSVIAGVIGKTKTIYDVWGDTVNVASRLENQGLSDTITFSEETWQLVKHALEFDEELNLQLKGKGNVKAYRINCKNSPFLF